MENKEVLLSEKKKDEKVEQNIDLLELLGIKIDDGKIEIDTNKTKSFFESLQKKVEVKATELEESIKKGKVDLKESVGVKVDNDKIEIDLNKTKSFLEEISNRFKSFVESIDSTINNISKKQDS